jgi:hypothetical protein
MTRRLPRLVLAAFTLNAALLAGALAAPSLVVGCSCAAPMPGAPIFSGDEPAVLVGHVGADDGRGVFAFTVERWFKGGDAAVVQFQSSTITFEDGRSVIDTCGLGVKPGQHLILAGGFSNGKLSAVICRPHASVNSGEGQAMLVAAINTFGEGIVPGEPPPEVLDDVPAIDLALVATLAVVGLLAIVAVGVVFSAIGRGERPAAKP